MVFVDFDGLPQLLDHIIEEHSKRVRKSAINLDNYESLEQRLIMNSGGFGLEEETGLLCNTENTFKSECDDSKKSELTCKVW